MPVTTQVEIPPWNIIKLPMQLLVSPQVHLLMTRFLTCAGHELDRPMPWLLLAACITAVIALLRHHFSRREAESTNSDLLKTS